MTSEKPSYSPFQDMISTDSEWAWLETLNHRDRQYWDRTIEGLQEVSPEMRWRIASWIMRSELSYARKVYFSAREGSLHYKADLIKENGSIHKDKIQDLTDRLGDLYEFILPLSCLVGDVEKAYQRLVFSRSDLFCVTDKWDQSWKGAAKGRGITGYDTPAGVERVRKEVKRFCSFKGKKGKK